MKVIQKRAPYEDFILDLDELEDACEGIDFISHQVAQLEIWKAVQKPEEDIKINTIGTLNVLKVAAKKGIKKIINASSACVYGQPKKKLQDENHPLNPNWPYGVSKLAAEKYCLIYSKLYSIPVTSLQYAIVYGEREW